MSRIFLALLICAALAFSLTHAQENAPATPPPPESPQPHVATTVGAIPPAPRKPKAAPKLVATPMPVATPIPRKPGFWARLFGRRTPRAAPRPKARPPVTAANETPKKPATTASPKPAVRKPSTPKPTPEGPEVVKPVPPVEKTEPKSTPEPKPRSTPTPRVKKETPAISKSVPAELPPGSDAEATERWKFGEARRKALEDPEVAGLKNKAENAPEGAEARKVMRAYNKALYEKMRKLEPGLKDRIDGTEAAVMKRIGE